MLTPAKKASVDPKYKFEQDSEVSVVGNYFAKAVAVIATNKKEVLLAEKNKIKSFPPIRKVFYEEPQWNPPLLNAHITAGIEAHVKEESAHWRRRGRPFPPELPQPSREKDQGPKRPEEFPHIMEKPIKAFGRKRVLHPEWTVAKSYQRCGEKAYELQDRVITPMTYRQRDYWGHYRERTPASSASFRSTVERFRERDKDKENGKRSPSREKDVEKEVEAISRLTRPSTMSASLSRLSVDQIDEHSSAYRMMRSRDKGFTFGRSGLTVPRSPSRPENSESLFESCSYVTPLGSTVNTGSVDQMVAKWAPPMEFSRSLANNNLIDISTESMSQHKIPSLSTRPSISQ